MNANYLVSEYYREMKRETRKLTNRKYRKKIKQKDENTNNRLSLTKFATWKRQERERKKQKEEKDKLRKIHRQTYMKRYQQNKTKQSSVTYQFTHRMQKSRAVKKMKMSLPDTPRRRVSTLAAYLSTKKTTQSPTVNTLEEMRIIRSPEDIEDDNVSNCVIRDLSKALNKTRYQRSTDSGLSRNIILAAVSGENIHKQKGKKNLAEKLGVSRKRIAAGRRMRTRILKSDESCWTITDKKNRSNKISDIDKRKAYNYWLSNNVSRPTGNKKDIKRERLAPHIFVSHMIHVLEKTQTEVYTEFLRDNPEIVMSQSSFERMKPFFVRPVRVQDRNTCCCRYHVEIQSVFKSCMDKRRNILEGKDDETKTTYPIYQNINDVIRCTVCEEDCIQQKQYKPECLSRNCEKCGIHGLKLMPEETTDNGLLEWEKFEYVSIVKGSQVRKKLLLVKKKTSVGELFKYFLHLLSSFPAHQFRAVWQNDQFKALATNLPMNDCICLHDFSENYR